MTHFKLSPLKEADAIRILVLYPSHEPTAPLSGSLVDTTLSACDSDFTNEYLALSYVWGNPASTSAIRINSIDVGITDSLAEALTQLRNACPGVPQRIWADALCINQSDTAEKNRQVPLMGTIYSLAKATVIYLGLSTPGIETIFKAVKESKPSLVTVDTDGKSQIAPAKSLHHLQELHVKRGHEPSAAAIDELLRRPWFTRVWVTQELLLSRDAWVQCGGLRVRWRDLGALLVPILDQTKEKDSTALQQMYSLSLGDADLRSREYEYKYPRRGTPKPQGHKRSLSYILRMRRGCRASDPRDMIFGYMGMHVDRKKVAEFFAVDYEMPLRQLLISTARYIYHCDGLEVLLRCVKRSPTNNWLNLPSWVPDWGIHEWSQVTSNTDSTIEEDEMLIGRMENVLYYQPHRDPKFIRYVSPILPRPQDVPQRIVDFLERAARIVRHASTWRIEEMMFLTEDSVSFWRDLDRGSSDPQDPSSFKLFLNSFWDPDAEEEGKYLQKEGLDEIPYKHVLATRAYQTLSFFMGYVGSRTMSASKFQNAFAWDLYEGQKMRLALSTAGFVLAVPAYVQVGDVFMRLDRSSSTTQKLHAEKDVFGGVLRPLARGTSETCTKAFKWICFSGVPHCKEDFYGDDYHPGFSISLMQKFLPNEIDNDGLKDLKHIELY